MVIDYLFRVVRVLLYIYINIYIYIYQIDSMLPCVCSVIDHR